MRLKQSRVPGMLRAPNYKLYGSHRHVASRKAVAKRFNPKSGKRWIQRAIKRPGALRRKLAAGYVPGYKLKGKARIPETILERAYVIARRRGDTRTMQQIGLARRLKGFGRSKGTRSYAKHRIAANPRSVKHWTIKWRP